MERSHQLFKVKPIKGNAVHRLIACPTQSV